MVDLFCGVGPFALRLAAKRPRHRLSTASPRAIAALQKAAGTPGLKPMTIEVARSVPAAAGAAELEDVDAVVFDPPRQGAEAQASELAKSEVPLVVAVSCNAATFARDARMLIDGGYKLDQRHAGRPVPLHPACRTGGAVRAVNVASASTTHAVILRRRRAAAASKDGPRVPLFVSSSFERSLRSHLGITAPCK